VSHFKLSPIVVTTTKEIDSVRLWTELKTAVDAQFTEPKPDTRYGDKIGRTLGELDFFVSQELMPSLATIKRVMSAYDFSSPLNFIMLPADFRAFYSVFYHADTLAKHATNLITDSLFWSQGDPKVTKRKQETAYLLKKSLDDEVEAALRLLSTYSELVDRDTLNCQTNESFSPSCFFRKYGATLLCLSSIAAIYWLSFRVFANSLEQKHLSKSK